MVIIIMSIVSTMILGTWFALSRAYASSTQSAKQRDHAQMAMARLTRELRDVQAAPPASLDARGDLIHRARPHVDTVQHDVQHGRGGRPAPRCPGLFVTAWRARPCSGSSPGADRQFGTGDDRKEALVEHVVNTANNADLFQYYYYDGVGDLRRSTSTTNVPAITARIKAIKISLLVDLQPGHSPEHMKMINVVQPRNQRNF